LRAARSKKHKLTAEKVEKLIDEGPYAARAALKAGLIDRTAYDDDYPEVMAKILQAGKVKIVKNYGKPKEKEMDLLTLYRSFLFGKPKKTSSRNLKVAVIYATGAITTGKSSSGLLGGEVMGSDTIIKAIRDAEADKTVKAIVLRVDSPGGSALASDLIWKELRKSKKPVIASMSDVAASGGYYISMAAKKIYAEPGTLTGSIGVVGGKLATEKLWHKVGIKTEVIARGAHSGILSSDTPFSESERKTMKGLMEDIYDQFVSKALQGRKAAGKKMTRRQLLKLAGGRVWTGRQAKENGLIDELGTLDDAIAAAAKLGGLPAGKEPELLQLPRSRGLLDSILESAAGAKAPSLELKLLPLARKVPGLLDRLRPVEGILMLRGQPVWMVLPYSVRIR
jgi:protease-4